jgi:hypothetical protein
VEASDWFCCCCCWAAGAFGDAVVDKLSVLADDSTGRVTAAAVLRFGGGWWLVRDKGKTVGLVVCFDHFYTILRQMQATHRHTYLFLGKS